MNDRGKSGQVDGYEVLSRRVIGIVLNALGHNRGDIEPDLLRRVQADVGAELERQFERGKESSHSIVHKPGALVAKPLLHSEEKLVQV